MTSDPNFTRIDETMDFASDEGVDNALADVGRESPAGDLKGRRVSAAVPAYDFELGVDADGDVTLEAVKSWQDGADRLTEVLKLNAYGSFEAAEVDRQELKQLKAERGLDAAMNVAEALAEAGGGLDPNRTDGRLFTDGPPDPFVTRRELDLLNADYFEDPDYSFELYERDEETLELQAVKRWEVDDGGYLAREAQVLASFDPTDRAEADVQQNAFREIRRMQGLDAAMSLAESLAKTNGHLDPNRAGRRLFRGGPPDPFTTAREAELTAAEPLWMQDLPPVEARAEIDTPAPDWRFDHRKTVTPAGEPLGTALFMTVFPDGEPVESDTVTRAQQLEVAHFETAEAASAFEADFRGHLAPGVIEGPELAEAVAALEEMPGEWLEMEGRNMDALTSGEQTTLVRKPEDWHPHNPNAERDARIEVEGLYTDPFHQLTTFDEDDPKVEPTAPDFEL